MWRWFDKLEQQMECLAKGHYEQCFSPQSLESSQWIYHATGPGEDKSLQSRCMHSCVRNSVLRQDKPAAIFPK